MMHIHTCRSLLHHHRLSNVAIVICRSLTSSCAVNVKHELHYSVMDELSWRGLVYDTTAPTSSSLTRLSKHRTGVYVGFDPSADSLHVGNLVSIMGLLHFHRAGHQAVALLGGATGFIGDPSGRLTERDVTSNEVLQRNIAGIGETLQRIIRNSDQYWPIDIHESDNRMLNRDPISLVNNADWYRDRNVVEFLGSVGRYFRMSSMLSKDSVKTRMDKDGMSLSEFCYQMFQAYDFFYLYHHHGVTVQLGGSDQWGNIISGCDLIRRMPSPAGSVIDSGDQYSCDKSEAAVESPNPSLGMTFPLLTTESGEKFGKSAGNAVWLSANRTKPLDLFQYFIRTQDNDVLRLLRVLTLFSSDYIDEIMNEHEAAPNLRLAQNKLAEAVTTMVHGKQEMRISQITTRLLYSDGSSSKALSASESDFEAIAGSIPTSNHPRSILLADNGIRVTDLFARLTGLVKSVSEVKRLVVNNAIFINDERVTNVRTPLRDNIMLHSKFTLLRVGKKLHHIIRWVD